MTEKEFRKLLKKEKHPIISHKYYFDCLYILLLFLVFVFLAFFIKRLALYRIFLLFLFIFVILSYIRIFYCFRVCHKFDEAFNYYHKTHKILKVKDYKKVYYIIITMICILYFILFFTFLIKISFF